MLYPLSLPPWQTLSYFGSTPPPPPCHSPKSDKLWKWKFIIKTFFIYVHRVITDVQNCFDRTRKCQGNVTYPPYPYVTLFQVFSLPLRPRRVTYFLHGPLCPLKMTNWLKEAELRHFLLFLGNINTCIVFYVQFWVIPWYVVSRSSGFFSEPF